MCIRFISVKCYISVIVVSTILGATLYLVGAQKTKTNKSRVSQQNLKCFKIATQSDKESFKINEKIVITVRLKNISNTTCHFVRESPLLLNYSVTFKNNSGEDLIKTKFYENALKFGVTSLATSSVKPNEEFLVVYNLNELFQINKVGRYSIIFKKSFFTTDPLKKYDLESDIIRIRVDS